MPAAATPRTAAQRARGLATAARPRSATAARVPPPGGDRSVMQMLAPHGGLPVHEGTIGDDLPCLTIGAGPPLVVLSGLTGEHANPTGIERWMLVNMVQPFAETFAVHLVNRRPGLPASTTMRDLATDAAAAIRDMFDGPVAVVGISTGGSIALTLAIDHPDVVRADRRDHVGRIVGSAPCAREPHRGGHGPPAGGAGGDRGCECGPGASWPSGQRQPRAVPPDRAWHSRRPPGAVPGSEPRGRAVPPSGAAADSALPGAQRTSVPRPFPPGRVRSASRSPPVDGGPVAHRSTQGADTRALLFGPVHGHREGPWLAAGLVDRGGWPLDGHRLTSRPGRPESGAR